MGRMHFRALDVVLAWAQPIGHAQRHIAIRIARIDTICARGNCNELGVAQRFVSPQACYIKR